MGSLQASAACYLMVTRVLSALMFLIGLLSVLTGALGLHFVEYAAEVAEWPAQSGSGIWVGIVAIIAGILGLSGSFCEMEMCNGKAGAFKCCMSLHFAASMASAVLSVTNLSYSCQILSDWTRDLQMWYCVGDYPFVVMAAGMNIVVSLVVGTTGITLFTVGLLASHHLKKSASCNGPPGFQNANPGVPYPGASQGAYPGSSQGGVMVVQSAMNPNYPPVYPSGMAAQPPPYPQQPENLYK